jgi:hypothetical protein
VTLAILDVLRATNFGERVAEEEVDDLASYFVETDQWRRLFGDQVDVVYGPKGAGKSALYSLLVLNKSELFDRGVLLVPAENPRGAPAFRDLVADPPISEIEFTSLWKLYFVCVVVGALDDYGIPGAAADELRRRLDESGLRPRERSLQSILKSAFDYVKRLLRPSAIEGGLQLDPVSQLPVGLSGKITLSEPSTQQANAGVASVEYLLKLADRSLDAAGYTTWITLDRLDVAFSDSQALEQNALRALFHVYLDMLSLKRVRLKIFLRTDIWRRITTSGFREASHITRHLTIGWNRSALLNLVIKRAARNSTILDHYSVSREEVLATTASQEAFFYRMFPEQVEAGPRKANTLDWMLGRTCDASRQNAPRELIHLMNSLRDVQTSRLEMGDPAPEAGRLFARSVFKDALPEVSRVRLEQTLYAEYPDAREKIERLRGEKTQYTVTALAAFWHSSASETVIAARELAEIGFFEERGSREDPIFWVPLLYRDGLDLVQGAAE